MKGRSDIPQFVKQSAVSRFSWCGCGTTIYDEAHLKIQTTNVLLEPGQAAAISYGIGDFGRQLHVFGHRESDEIEPVRLMFGGEWDISNLKSSLVNLSEQHGAIWFDQLSIPQDPALIPIHLQNVPEIYRHSKSSFYGQMLRAPVLKNVSKRIEPVISDLRPKMATWSKPIFAISVSTQSQSRLTISGCGQNRNSYMLGGSPYTIAASLLVAALETFIVGIQG